MLLRIAALVVYILVVGYQIVCSICRRLLFSKRSQMLSVCQGRQYIVVYFGLRCFRCIVVVVLWGNLCPAICGIRIVGGAVSSLFQSLRSIVEIEFVRRFCISG